MKKKILNVVIVVLIVVIAFCAYKIISIMSEYNQGVDTYDATAEEFVRQSELDVPISVDFKALQKKNSDVIGWLYCEGTNINYPLLQGEDNDSYIYTLVDGTSNSSGSLFVEIKNRTNFMDFNTIIHGHNMNNGSMFGQLDEYKDQEFYDEHPVMWLLTPTQNYRVDLIGGYEISAYDEIAYSIPIDQEGRDKIITQAQENSTFKAKELFIGDNDKLVTLSTCDYDYEDARYVVVGLLRAVN